MKMHRRLLNLMASTMIALGMLILLSCNVSQYINQDQDVTSPSGGLNGPSASPSPSGVVSRVSCEIFGPTTGDTCRPQPDQLRLAPGCSWSVTATPKDALGNKLPESIHGPEAQWFSSGNVTLFRIDDNEFNRGVRAASLGDFEITAVVKGVSGKCVGRVVP